VKSAGIREVKNRLSHYLRVVEQGETVLVTDRGTVVAQLCPPPTFLGDPDQSEHEALHRLARQGKARLGVGSMPSATMSPLPPPGASVDLQAVLNEVRADRP
jgi:prevent-host-death family protein